MKGTGVKRVEIGLKKKRGGKRSDGEKERGG
jgi:hypothetical protein